MGLAMALGKERSRLGRKEGRERGTKSDRASVCVGLPPPPRKSAAAAAAAAALRYTKREGASIRNTGVVRCWLRQQQPL